MIFHHLEYIDDEKTNKEINGIVLFNSIESIEHEFEEYKSFNPSLFDMYNITVISRKFFVKKKEEYKRLIDTYANATSRKAPKSFRLK